MIRQTCVLLVLLTTTNLENENMSKAHFMLIGQKVRDFKVPHNDRLAAAMGELRSLLQESFSIPGDKVPAALNPKLIDGDTLYATLDGPFLSRKSTLTTICMQQAFPMRFKNTTVDIDSLPDVMSAVRGIRIDDGGNINNMLINLIHAIRSLAGHNAMRSIDVQITMACSSDPFARFNRREANAYKRSCDFYQLNMDDRYAVQVPWENAVSNGHLTIASEPSRTVEPLIEALEVDDALRSRFESANCFITADPIYEALQQYKPSPPYTNVINASTAFRALVASESYKRSVLLPMNDGEAEDVSKLILHRAHEQELKEVRNVPFYSPVSPDGERIDFEALCLLDQSIVLLEQYIPPTPGSFTCPITFGAEGGLIVGAGAESIACFSTVPNRLGEKRMLAQFLTKKQICPTKEEVGAGDAVATLVSIFNTISPRLFTAQFFKGQEEEKRFLCEIADAVFVSLLCRLAGNVLIRTKRTNWGHLSKAAMVSMVDAAAKEAVSIARGAARRMHDPVLAECERWGIKIVAWKLGQVNRPAIPDGLSEARSEELMGV